METSGYNIENIILIESNFKRTHQVALDLSTVEQKSNINAKQDMVGADMIVVYLTLDFVQSSKQTQINEVEAKITFAGVFKVVGAPSVPIDKFATTNAPSIIFPYIREELSVSSIKAGLQPIIIAPVNFAGSVQTIQPTT